MSVRPSGTSLSRAINLHLHFIGQRAIGEQVEHSESDQRTLRQQSESNQRAVGTYNTASCYSLKELKPCMSIFYHLKEPRQVLRPFLEPRE